MRKQKCAVAALSVLILTSIICAIFYDGLAPTKLETPVSLTYEVTNKKLKGMGLEPIYNPLTTTDPWKTELFQRLDRIRVACGELCNMNSVEALSQHLEVQPSVSVQGPLLFGRVVAPPNCPAIFACRDIDAGDITTPPIPDELRTYFTLRNATEFYNKWLRKDIYLGGNALVPNWTKDEIEGLIQKMALRQVHGTYGVSTTNYVLDRLSTVDMKDKSVLVIGSETPWLEAMCLHLGAAKVTTLEYGKINSLHPQVFTMMPDEFRVKYLKGELEHFDGVVSHSSLEHAGLGRYGDALNPWGDILAVARAWCVTKSGGFLYLGIPTSTKDGIYSNWHRIYGPLRWPLITANWRLAKDFGEKQLPSHGRDVGYIFHKEALSKKT